MSAQTIRNALGLLQDDPENEQAWTTLEQAVESCGPDDALELAELLEAARRAHEMRREHEAVAALLSLEIRLVVDPAVKLSLQSDLARVYDEELLDDSRAVEAYERVRVLDPSDPRPLEALERCELRRSRWREISAKFDEEAREGSDRALKSSLLVSAAETLYRYAQSDDKNAEVDLAGIEERLRAALAIDPRNRRAATLLDRVLRRQQKWEDLASVLMSFATEATSKDDKIAGYVRLARVSRKKLENTERSAAAYERVIELSPGHREATSALVEFFNEREMWDHLVALYEEQLKGGGVRPGQETGVLLQIAMVHWKSRGKPEAAEPYFERLRRTDPAHRGVLSFFREYCGRNGDRAKLASVLGDARRVMQDGPDRAALAIEIAKLAEEGANAQKAIEQWRAILRSEPENAEARSSLKRLYRQTSTWNSLIELLRNDLDRLPVDDVAARTAVLREIAAVYRDHAKNDAALVTVLTQVCQADPSDIEAFRELARAHESLGRFRDLLAVQAKLAELETEPSLRVEILRSVARRWIDQFNNVQNAVDAYERLDEVAHGDREARDRLRELYTKRRAFRPLYDLLAREANDLTEGEPRRQLWLEMAKLLAERLDRPAEAADLYRQVLAEVPDHAASLDALEKHAEREKDYASVAWVLERRLSHAADDSTSLTLLQKLGALYGDRLGDVDASIRTWKRVLSLSPNHAKASRVLRDTYLSSGDYDGLTQLFASHGDWEGLAEVLSSAADKAESTTSKVDLSFRAAAIYEERLSARERALRSYERVLACEPTNVKAASRLVPLYEREERWNRLPHVLEVLYGAEQDLEARLALLARLVSVSTQKTLDKVAAFSYAKAAFELSPEREGALGELARCASAAGRMEELTVVLRSRIASEDCSKEERRALRARVAEILCSDLGRVDEASLEYRALLEEDAKDAALVQAADEVFRKYERHEDIRWLFELRLERANTAHRIELLLDWAELEEQGLASLERAAEIHRRVLSLVPHHGKSLRSLARLLLATGRPEEALTVLEQERDLREGAERAAREVEIGRLLLAPLGRHGEALAAVTRALALEPNDVGAVGVLENLLPFEEVRAQCARELLTVYSRRSNASDLSRILRVVIETETDSTILRTRYLELASVFESGLLDVRQAFDVLCEACRLWREDLDLWDRLSDLGTKLGAFPEVAEAMEAALRGAEAVADQTVVDLSERAAQIWDERVGDLDKARPHLERIVRLVPTHERSFARLKQILTTKEQWSSLEELYELVIRAADAAARRVSLLLEVALVAEEVRGDAGKAIAYYERVLDEVRLEPRATRALLGLYESTQAWEKLVAILAAKLETADSDEALELRVRMATILMDKLGDHARSLSVAAEVLGERPLERNTREIVERLLSDPVHRAQAAVVLEQVYVERDDPSELVRILNVRLETATSDDLAPLLRRIVSLEVDRLHDDAGAFDALSRLIPVVPDDAVARAEFVRVGARMGRFDDVAAVLQDASEKAGNPDLQAELLLELATIWQERLGKIHEAERALRAALSVAVDPAPRLAAAERLVNVYASSERHRELCETLKLQAKLPVDPEVRRDILGRLGEVSETVLADLQGAIEAYRERQKDDPEDLIALRALDRLLVQTQAWEPLVEILRALELLAKSGEERRGLLTRIAEVLSERLTDIGEAIATYRRIVDEFGPDRVTLGALATLYEVSDRFQDLADTLEADLELVAGADERLVVYTRLAEIRRTKLSDAPGALDACREALVLDSSHGPSRAMLEGLLGDAHTRVDAARVLRPLFEADGEHQKLLDVIEIEIAAADSVEAKLADLSQASSVSELALKDLDRAFDYACRGLREAAVEPSVREWVARVKRLGDATAKHDRVVEVLRAASVDVLDGDVQVELLLDLAHIAVERLSDLPLARACYAKVLELRSDDERALAALEALYERLEDYSALLDVLRRRVDVSMDDAARVALLYKQAKVAEERLSDPAAAISALEQVLERGVDAPAITALERLYAATERWEDLAALYERRLEDPGLSGSDKANIHHALGIVLESRIREPERAFDEFSAALAEDAQHAPTVATLEALVASGAHVSRAAEILEAVYRARPDWKRVMEVLEVRVTAADDTESRATLLRRLSRLYEEQAEDFGAALETTARLLSIDVTDQTTWAELERLAKVSNAERRLADIFAKALAAIPSDEEATARLAFRTGEIFESLGERESSLIHYQRAYAFDRESQGAAFQAVDRLLADAGRFEQRVTLHRDALEYRADPDDRIASLRTIAQIQERDLRDVSAAVQSLEAILEAAPEDADAYHALHGIYTNRGEYDRLADLIRRRADVVADRNAAVSLRIELAGVIETKMGDRVAALDEYSSALAEATSDELQARVRTDLERLLAIDDVALRVVEILRPVYEQMGHWRGLIGLDERRLSFVKTPVERAALLADIARLWEDNGQDQKQAFSATSAAWEEDPEDSGARENLYRLAGQLGNWDELSEVAERALSRAVPEVRKDILAELARMHDERRDDPRSALSCWSRVVALDPTDVVALGHVEALATLLSEWAVVVQTLSRRADAAMSDDERSECFQRIADVERDMLENDAKATAALERALELDPSSARVLDGLISLYENESNSGARLASLYRQRIDVSGEEDAELSFGHMRSLAVLLEKQGQTAEATEAWEEALARKPADLHVLAELGRLYRALESHRALADNLVARVALVEGAERLELQTALGLLYAEKLEDPEAALDVFCEVVATGGFDDRVIDACMGIARKYEEHRRRVAELLAPELRARSNHALLVELLEQKLSVIEESASRIATLFEIAELHASNGASATLGLHARLRALMEPAADEETMDRIAAVCEELGDPAWQAFADKLADKAKGEFDAELSGALYYRLGVMHESKLAAPSRAVEAYRAALDRSTDTRPALVAMDRLLTAAGDFRSLADVLERRVAGAETDAEKAELGARLGDLYREHLNVLSSALHAYRGALEAVPGNAAARAGMRAILQDSGLFEEAFEALDSAFRASGDSAALVALYEERRAGASTRDERRKCAFELLRVLEEQANDASRAARLAAELVVEDPTDESATDALVRLAEQLGDYRLLADSLAAGLSSAEGLDRAHAVEWWVRVSSIRGEKLGEWEGAEDALVKARKLEPDNSDVLEQLESVLRRRGSVLPLADVLSARAKLASDFEDKSRLYFEAARLAQGAGEPEIAERAFRDLLSEDDTNLEALAELCALREAVSDHREVVDLLLRRADLTGDGAEAATHRRRAAKLLRESLNELERAFKIYDELFELDPDDAESRGGLLELGSALGRHERTASVLERWVDVAASPEERTELRLRLAGVQREHLQRLGDAIESLRAILDELPHHEGAVVELSRILEQDGRSAELADLLESELEAAKERADTDMELSLLVRLGTVYESSLGDTERARETYQKVLGRDAAHKGALLAVARLAEKHLDWAAMVDALERVTLHSDEDRADAYARLARGHEMLGAPQRALDAWEGLLRVRPNDDDARAKRRALLEAVEDWERLASALLEDAERIDGEAESAPPVSLAGGASPNRSPTLVAKLELLGRAVRVLTDKRNAPKEAIVVLEQMTRLAPFDRERLLELADAYQAAGESEKSADVLERVIASFGTKRTKELATYHQRLARARKELGDNAKALEHLDQAFKVDPGSVVVLKDLGLLALETGDLDRAQKSFRALLLQRLDGAAISKAEVFLCLAKVSVAQNDKPKAIQMLERALENDAGLEAARTLLDELKTA